MLSIQTIFPDTLELLNSLVVQPELQSMRLVGGTALALQYGHRQSVDLDFFSCETIDQDKLLLMLQRIGQYTILNRTTNILQVIVKDIKVDFVQYNCYDWIDDPVIENNIVLASAKDIAAMKINAIIGRGSKKDFVDLYLLLQHYTLEEIISFYQQKYPDHVYSRIFMSLTYFDDAENQAMPVSFISESWEDMKKSIISAVREYQQ